MKEQCTESVDIGSDAWRLLPEQFWRHVERRSCQPALSLAFRDSHRTASAEIHQNDASAVGLKVSRLMVSKDAGNVVAVNLGPEMIYYLKKRYVKAYHGSPNLTVRDAIEQFKQGRLPRLRRPTVTCRYGKRLPTPH